MLILLTAARTGEVTGATWEEFDLDAQVPVWIVPAARMKGRRPERGSHRVPLSQPAGELLKNLSGKRTGQVFIGQSGGKPISDTALRKLLRKLTGDNSTVHGLRSTFRDWAAECTDCKPEVAEAALAHALGDDVETAYWRTDQFDQRVKLMADWARFLANGSAPTTA
jgi:integrase